MGSSVFLTTMMGRLLAQTTILLTAFICGRTGEECCKFKKVGRNDYTWVSSNVEVPHTCKNKCTYNRDDEPGSLYCFAVGEEPVTCKDRVRKNLNSLSTEEIHKLIGALNEAKKAKTYNGPPINGTFDKNPKNFNSSYDAAVSFHGYPGLCGGLCCIHVDPLFPPWHRLFMVQIEDALRNTNAKYKDVTLPYWDWTVFLNGLNYLVDNRTINDTKRDTVVPNPFYHSLIPGKSAYTKRSPEVLIEYTNQNLCIVNKSWCQQPNKTFVSKETTVLMDLVLFALEPYHTYVEFEKQFEYPHNQVHNLLGLTPNQTNCTEFFKPNFKPTFQPNCYPYTMQRIEYAAFDPIFLSFHIMVDRLWAIFEALQKYRNRITNYPCSFKRYPLQPFSNPLFNSNYATKSHSLGIQTVNYETEFGYKYDNLSLNGMTIPELDRYLQEKNNVDRLFAGFSLPTMRIHRITFSICYPITNCSSFPSFHVSRIHQNTIAMPGVLNDKVLLYFEVTKYLAILGLDADKNIVFKISSTSIPKNVTFAPLSIYRKAGSDLDRITVYWHSKQDHAYAPAIKVRRLRRNSIRFISDNGTSAAYQYKTSEDFQTCSEHKELVSGEIELVAGREYYFQNPNKTECKDENKFKVEKEQKDTDCCTPVFNRTTSTIGWCWMVERQYPTGICVKPGTRLTFVWNAGTHNVTKVADKDAYEKCNFSHNGGYAAPHNLTYPPQHEEVLQEGVYYFVCPVKNHCKVGNMKVKVNVKHNCDD